MSNTLPRYLWCAGIGSITIAAGFLLFPFGAALCLGPLLGIGCGTGAGYFVLAQQPMLNPLRRGLTAGLCAGGGMSAGMALYMLLFIIGTVGNQLTYDQLWSELAGSFARLGLNQDAAPLALIPGSFLLGLILGGMFGIFAVLGGIISGVYTARCSTVPRTEAKAEQS